MKNKMNIKKILLWSLVGLIALVGGIFFFKKKSDTSNLEGKRKGIVPLSDAEAQNFLNTYSDLTNYWVNNPHLSNNYSNILEWAKAWWVNHGIADGRTFESKVRIW